MDQIGAIRLQRLVEFAAQALAIVGHTARDQISIRDFDKIRIVVEKRLAVVFVKKELLPLADHAQAAVVHDQDFDRQVQTGQQAQFLDGHLKAAITREQDGRPVRFCHRRANGSRQSKAHRAQTAGRDERAWRFDRVMLGDKHLMLTNVRDHERIGTTQARGDLVDDILRRQGRTVMVHVHDQFAITRFFG